MEGIMLMAIEPSDIEFIVEMENMEDSFGYTERIAPLSYQSVKTYVMTLDPDPYATGQLRLKITVGGEPAGLLDFYEISAIHRRAMVGILLRPKFRGKGIGRRSLVLAQSFARKRLRLENLGAIVSTKNKPSAECFIAAGFEERGVLKNWWRTTEGAEDCLMLQSVLNRRINQ